MLELEDVVKSYRGPDEEVRAVDRVSLRLRAGESILAEWRDNLVNIGKQVHIRAGDDVFEGIAESVADDGSLMLRCTDSRLMKFTAGDVTLSKNPSSK